MLFFSALNSPSGSHMCDLLMSHGVGDNHDEILLMCDMCCRNIHVLLAPWPLPGPARITDGRLALYKAHFRGHEYM